jgi:hypothetical protein
MGIMKKKRPFKNIFKKAAYTDWSIRFDILRAVSSFKYMVLQHATLYFRVETISALKMAAACWFPAIKYSSFELACEATRLI